MMKKKRKFKMPSAYTLLFSIIVVIAVLTWIVPAGEYELMNPGSGEFEPIPGTYTQAEQNPQGIWEILYAPIRGFFDAIDIAFFVLIIGGFIGVMVKTGAIDAGIGRIVHRLQGREHLLIPVLMTVFALGGTTYGMAEETIAFYPLLIPVLIAAGYDSLTAVSIIALGAGVGVLGSTMNPFATGIASGFAGISIGEGIVLRLIILILSLVIAVAFVMRYARRVKEDPKKSLVADMKEDNEQHFLKGQSEGVPNLTGRRKAVLWVFGLTFLIMVLAVIPWADKFNISIFETINDALVGMPVIGPVLGNGLPLGDWWFGELTLLFLLASIIIAVMYRMGEKEFTSTFVEGARDLLGVALIIGISRGISIVMSDGGMTATVLHWGEMLLDGIGPIAFANLSYLFYLPLAFLVPSTSGLATLSMPIMAPLAEFAGVGPEMAITAFQSAAGLVNLVTPTSAVIMGALAIARVPYNVYLRHVWKLLIVLSIMIMAVMSFSVLL